MSGGTSEGQHGRCVRRVSATLLCGLLAAPWALFAPGAFAEEAATTADADSATAANSSASRMRRNEKSIIIDDSGVDAEPDVAMATDQSSATLPEPVASVSEYEADFVDSTATDALPRTELAEPQQSVDDEADAEYAAEEDSAPPVALEPASFNGLVPGVTTRAEVIKEWGKPASQSRNDDTLKYRFKSFPSVEVTFDDNRVETIRVELFEPVSTARLTTKLGLVGVQPTTVANEAGVSVSTIFPERGVALNHRPAAGAAVDAADRINDFAPQGDDAVYEIELSAINADHFLWRAEAGERTQQFADLEIALQLDPASAKARAMLAGLKLASGQAIAAEKLAAEAVQLEPKNDDYRLQWARCLRHLAKYDEAVREIRTVLEGPQAEPIVRAQALEQMGLLASLGPKEVQERAIPLHTKAIALADELSASKDPATRVAAMQLLVEAHLAVAEQVAGADWKNKDEAVANWIGRASGLAEEMIAGGEADVSLRLQVAISALAAGGRLDPPIDPALWIAEAEQAVNRLHAQSTAGAASAELDWQLGLAYCYAMEIQHRRGEAENALKYGSLAEAAMAPLAESRAEFPDTEFVLGRLYFQIGAVHAVHGHDHAMACRWYDRAVPALRRPAPVTMMAGPKPHSDALVSMGVSYWATGQKEQAYELTQAGVALAQQGVAERLVSADAAKVAQHNLDAMNRAMGVVEFAEANGETSEVRVAEVQEDSTPGRRTPSRARTANRRSPAETRRQ